MKEEVISCRRNRRAADIVFFVGQGGVKAVIAGKGCRPQMIMNTP
jgi:hypothetical protein